MCTFHFIGHSNELEFSNAFKNAMERLAFFASLHGWATLVQNPNFIERVEVYPSKEVFDRKLIELSGGKWESVPETFVGVVDQRVMRVISFSEYQRIHPEDSLVDYEKLLTHEMAHQLHIDILGGNEDEMGPVWFFEGFAVVAAKQYEDYKLTDLSKMKEVILDSNRGDYKSYGAIVMHLMRTHSLPELVEMAKGSEFNAKVIGNFLGLQHE